MMSDDSVSLSALSALDDDPSTSEGHRVVYDREVPFEMRVQLDEAPRDAGALESLRVKLLVLGDSEVRMPVSGHASMLKKLKRFFYSQVRHTSHWRHWTHCKQTIEPHPTRRGLLLGSDRAA